MISYLVISIGKEKKFLWIEQRNLANHDHQIAFPTIFVGLSFKAWPELVPLKDVFADNHAIMLFVNKLFG